MAKYYQVRIGNAGAWREPEGNYASWGEADQAGAAKVAAIISRKKTEEEKKVALANTTYEVVEGKKPRYVSELASWPDHFVSHIYDTHQKKSLRGIKLKDQRTTSVIYECVEVVIGKVGEAYPDFNRRAEERLAELNSQDASG